jgi:hypothetical protein
VSPIQVGRARGRIGHALTKPGQTRNALFLVPILLSWHILSLGIFPTESYDLAKVKWYLMTSDSLRNYIDGLGFGQGIALQTYLFNKVFGVSADALRYIDYAIFIAAYLILVKILLAQSRARDIVLPVALIASFTFSSQLISALAAYGMIVYSEGVLFGACLLFLLQKDIIDRFLSDRTIQVVTLALVSFFVFVQITNVMYATFLIVVILVFNPDRFKPLLGLGIAVAVISCASVYVQLRLFPSLSGFKPPHVLPLLYSADADQSVVAFIYERSTQLVRSMTDGTWYSSGLLSVLVLLGALHSLRRKQHLELLLLITLCTLSLVTLSVLGVHPYGSVRYCLPLLIPVLFFAYQGAYRLGNHASRSLAAGATIVFALAVLHGLGMSKDIFSATRTVHTKQAEARAILGGFDGPIFVDVITEPIFLSWGMTPKQVVSSWNIQTHTEEDQKLYADFRDNIRDATRVRLYLSIPFDDPYLEPIRIILKQQGFSRRAEAIYGYNYLFQKM